jgi:carboxylate-amine ligase
MKKIVPAMTYGIEEEFFLVDPCTRRLCGDRTTRLLSACRTRLGDRVSEEMIEAQIEIATPILHTTNMARESLTELRWEVGRIAGRFDLGLLAASTHPLGDWEKERNQAKPRYERLTSDYRMIGRRNLLCGLHVHVGVPTDIDRVELMNRVLPWLPLFLALSASSPFWRGVKTGLASYRQSAYDEWPRSGTPDAFDDETQYFGFVDLLRRHDAVESANDMWWTIRPSGKYPTLELRICDACTRIEDTLALAAAFRCLIRAHVRRPDLGTRASAITRRIVDENRWRAKRHGTKASFIDETSGEAIAARDALRAFQTLIAPDAAALRCEREIAHLTTILDEGTSADRQLALYRGQRERMKSRVEALESVVDWLIDITGDVGRHAHRTAPYDGSGVVNA